MLHAVVAKRVKRNCIRLECACYTSSHYQGPRGRPDTTYFLPHLFNRQNLGTEVDDEEIDELYPSATVELPNLENLRVLC